MTSKVDGRHAGISRFQVSVSGIPRLRVGYEVDTRVEVCHSHVTITEVGRSTEHTVAEVRGLQSSIALHDRRRHVLMWSHVIPSISQHLSEEDIIIRPNRIEIRISFCIHV